MGGKNVKNTIVERMLAGVAPHPCFGCGKLGTPLCIDCKYDIISDPFMGCIACARPTNLGVCENHRYDIERAFVPGVRSAALEATINGLKFHHTKAAAYDLDADLGSEQDSDVSNRAVMLRSAAPHATLLAYFNF